MAEANRPKSFASSSTHSSHKSVPLQVLAQGPTGAAPPPVGTPSHKMWTAYSGPVLFTGPDGSRDQKVKVQGQTFQMVGIGERSPEITSQMGYLSRPPPGQSFPKAKNGQIGEIGWPVEHFKIVKGI